jgi:glycyl-tRNA synthetase beta chain
MVGEFPELQGKMARLYAVQETKDVAQALEEHYEPLTAESVVPSQALSQDLALADKMDILVGFFGLGIKPSGSKDPYALRRAALGIIRILKDREMPLEALIERSIASYAHQSRVFPNSLTSEIVEFFKERLEAFLKGQGWDLAAIQAVMALPVTSHFSLREYVGKVETLDCVLKTERGQALKQLWRRVRSFAEVEDTSLPCSHPLEQELFALLEKSRNLPAMDQLQAVTNVGHRFLDDLTILSDVQQEQTVRLSLLTRVRRIFESIGDWNQTL